MKDSSRDTLDGSAAVPPPVAKQAEDPHRATNGGLTAKCQAHQEPWEWVEPAVWTDRMLAALQHGVKGGKWFSLMDKVAAERTLALAWERVKRKKGSPGVDRQTIAMFDAHADRYLRELSDDLRSGTFRPHPVKRTWIAKPGRKEKRPLGIPSVKDRVVQGALKLVLEPIFEATFAPQSYGFRPKRGCKDALRRVQELLNSGQVWVVDVDLQSYFDSIPHEALLQAVGQQVADGRVLDLLRSYLNQGILEGLQQWQPESGTPQGAVISPLLANIYLNPLDHALARTGAETVRYADDLVVLCSSQAEAEAALRLIQTWVTANGLCLHMEKTRIVDARERGGFEFLGYHFERGMRWPRRRSELQFREAIRAKTGRSNGDSMVTIVKTINPIIRGWYEYYKHSHKATFQPKDAWVRMRLRSILRKRHRGQGRGHGLDHLRWPNSYFADLGLFTMSTARELARQSR